MGVDTRSRYSKRVVLLVKTHKKKKNRQTNSDKKEVTRHSKNVVLIVNLPLGGKQSLLFSITGRSKSSG